MTAQQATPRLDAVSPLFAEIRARYGAAFDAALERNVADALAEDVGDGDRTGRLVPADSIRDARILVREEAVLCGVPWFVAVMQRVDPSIEIDWRYREGDVMAADSPVCFLRGPARSLPRQRPRRRALVAPGPDLRRGRRRPALQAGWERATRPIAVAQHARDRRVCAYRTAHSTNW